MKTKLFVLFLIAMLTLAACGGGKDEAKPAAEPTAAAEVEQAEEALPEGDAAKGKAAYDTLCTACHGADGIGVEGLGKPLPSSEFVASMSDADFLAFIEEGRDVSHPDNTTGVAMPPKGGNPALSEEQMLDIIAYVRSLQE